MAKAKTSVVPRKICRARCLIPMKHRARPKKSRSTPATPVAALRLGCNGSVFDRSVAFDNAPEAPASKDVVTGASAVAAATEGVIVVVRDSDRLD